jgi:starch-binding outer membrane protein, SusD/RagB family
MRKTYYTYTIILSILLVVSCKKSSYLDAKSDQALVVPESLSDFQAILDNNDYMNGNSSSGGLLPDFLQTGTDDYFAVDAPLNSQPTAFKNLYVWNDDIYTIPFNDWSYSYRAVFYCNVVLKGLEKLSVSASQQQSFNNVKGSALFYRSHMFYQLAQIFAPVYELSTASNELGIPLRLDADISEPINRASLQHTYEQIIKDLKQATSLLPGTQKYTTRPTKPAAFALLARTYLSMQDYDNALLYSDSCIQLKNTLLDYNSITSTATYRFNKESNTEILLDGVIVQNPIILPGLARVDSTLLKSYASDDLRSILFFLNRPPSGKSFRGSYDGSGFLFGGIALDEVYLIRSECYARKGKTPEALNDLNTLLEKRWVSTTFIPYTATDANDALSKILTERRKELLFRGLRWTDLRRLNKSGSNISVTRNRGGQLFTLPPNSLNYTFLIPPDVMGFNPDIQQNKR